MKTIIYSKDRTIEEKKRDVLEELQKSMGIVTLACRKTRIGRTQFYLYKKEDETFSLKVDEITETFVDMVESKLLEKVMMGDRASVMFYLKAKGKNRGYY
jgi:hypothetical protein